MHRLFLLVGVVPLLTGCFYLPIFDSSSSSGSGEISSAQSNVRNSVPAIEAWYADNGTYAGMTVALIQHRYDTSVKDVTLVRPLNRKTYCVESTAGGETWSYRGPTRGFVAGGC